jgi:hypothetical protein
VTIHQRSNPTRPLRLFLTTRYASELKHTTSIRIWIHRAIETEIPIPVNNATYAATHSGHLGINTKRVAGKSHWILRHARRKRPIGCLPSPDFGPPDSGPGSRLQNGQLLIPVVLSSLSSRIRRAAATIRTSWSAARRRGSLPNPPADRMASGRGMSRCSALRCRDRR